MMSLYTECNSSKFIKRVDVATRKSDRCLGGNGQLFEANVVAKGSLDLQSTRSSCGVVAGKLTLRDDVGVAGLARETERSVELKWTFPISERQAQKELAEALAEKLSNNAHIVAARV